MSDSMAYKCQVQPTLPSDGRPTPERTRTTNSWLGGTPDSRSSHSLLSFLLRSLRSLFSAQGGRRLSLPSVSQSEERRGRARDSGRGGMTPSVWPANHLCFHFCTHLLQTKRLARWIRRHSEEKRGEGAWRRCAAASERGRSTRPSATRASCSSSSTRVRTSHPHLQDTAQKRPAQRGCRSGNRRYVRRRLREFLIHSPTCVGLLTLAHAPLAPHFPFSPSTRNVGMSVTIRSSSAHQVRSRLREKKSPTKHTRQAKQAKQADSSEWRCVASPDSRATSVTGKNQHLPPGPFFVECARTEARPWCRMQA